MHAATTVDTEQEPFKPISVEIALRGPPPPLQVWLRTEEYLKDALGSVVTDIEDMAVNLLAFVNAQVIGRLMRCRAIGGVLVRE